MLLYSYPLVVSQIGEWYDEKVKIYIKKNVAKFHKLSLIGKIIAVLIVIGVLFTLFTLRDLPSPTRLSSTTIPQSTQIFDRNNTLLYTIHGDKNQTFLPLSEIPKSVQQATIAIEDKDFYYHGAVDMRGMFRAAISTLVYKQVQGGSTLTQQLVKNSLLTQEKTITRKTKEVLLAFATELLYSKDKILEMYLNQSPYGGTAYGVEAASQTYFGKHAKELTLPESALLAGLSEAPTYYSPYGAHPELAKQRQEEVLRKMSEQGYITVKQKNDAIKTPLVYQRISNNIQAPHFVLYIKDLLVKKYGEKIVEEGGLKVKTSLDLNIQNFAQNTVASEVAKLTSYRVGNGATIVTNPATGEILAMVGSKDYFSSDIDGNVNVTIALRQPGSSIKPINYAVGLIKGYTAAMPFVDIPTCFPNPGHIPYCPVNYDGKFHGVLSMRLSLGNSINIPAVKMLKLNGVEAMIATASAMGITTFNQPERYGLSLTLGGGEVTMLEMATAYGVFANKGYRINLHPILEVKNNQGNILENYAPPISAIFGKKVMPASVPFIISEILSDNGARSLEFGPNSELKIPNQIVAVKTGTTNDLRDNWTIGYTPSYLVAVWVGNNDNSSMSGLASGITGAAPIWNKIMKHLLNGRPQEPFQRPEGIIGKTVCNFSGLIPSSENACPSHFEYFVKGTEPIKVDPGLQKVFVDKTTQDLAKPGQTDNVEEKDHLVVTDPLGDRYCVDCPHPKVTPIENKPQ